MDKNPIFKKKKKSFLEDHAIGLSTFTIMAGLGGSLGYAMGALDWGWLGKSIKIAKVRVEEVHLIHISAF